MKTSNGFLDDLKENIEEIQKMLDVNRDSLALMSETKVRSNTEVSERDKIILFLTNEREELQQSITNLKNNYSELVSKLIDD